MLLTKIEMSCPHSSITTLVSGGSTSSILDANFSQDLSFSQFLKTNLYLVKRSPCAILHSVLHRSWEP